MNTLAPGRFPFALTSMFLALLTNPYGLIKFGHTVTSGYVVDAFL